MSVRRSLIVLALVVIFVPFVVFNWMNQPQAASGSIDLGSLQLYEIRRGNLALTVTALGTVEAQEAVQLSFLVPGRVQQVFVPRDSYVLEGDMLVSLENEIQRIRYEQALLTLELAELAYQDLLEVDETALQIAQAGIDSALGAYYSITGSVSESDIRAAEIAYQQALDYSESQLVLRNDIGGRFGGDSIEWQSANARYGESTFQAEIARLQLERLRGATGPQASAAYARVLQAQAELTRIQSGPTQTELDIAQTNINQARNQLSQAEITYQQTILAAPFAGVVTALNVEAGGLVGPGTVAVEITNPSTLTVMVQVDEIDIGLVEVGQSVRISLDALPAAILPARVESIAPVGTQAGGIVSYDVGIVFEGTDPRIRIGMTVEATIVIEETNDVLIIPNLYVRRERGSGGTFVNVLRPDNRIEEVAVELGVQSRDASQILVGLQEGDLVAIDLSGGGLNILGDGN